MSLLAAVRWPEIAVDGLQGLGAEVFGAAFGPEDEEDIDTLLGEFWYAPVHRMKEATQAINNYPTMYWQNLYKHAQEVSFLTFLSFSFIPSLIPFACMFLSA
jgi:hypothetical protein